MEDGEPCPCFACLAAERSYRGYAGEIEQHEQHERERRQGRETCRADISAIEDGKRGDDSFLGGQTCQQADRHLPVEAQRLQDRRDGFAYHREVGVLKVVQVLRGEILQRPDDD